MTVLFTSDDDKLQKMIEGLSWGRFNVWLKMNMQTTKIMLGALARKESTTEKQTMEVVLGICILVQLLTGKLTHVKRTCRRIGMGWCVYGRNTQLVNGNLLWSLRRKLLLHFASADIWGRNLENNKETREEVDNHKRLLEWEMRGITLR